MRRDWIVAAVCAAMAAAAPAAAEITVCTVVPQVPYTISQPGAYCLQQHLATPPTMTAGNAITINADNVTLDLNGFTVDGSASAAGTRSGIYASDRKNVTVRNGGVRAFYRGVYVRDTGVGGGNALEGLRISGSTFRGIEGMGKDLLVRSNQVIDSVAPSGNADAIGIRIQGARPRVLDNDVTGTLGSGTGKGRAIYLVGAQGAIVEGNRLGNADVIAASVGIELASGADTLVLANSITTMQSGIVFAGTASGKYRDNVTSGVTTPYTGGTDAGNNQ
jgi:hypothetical protein